MLRTCRFLTSTCLAAALTMATATVALGQTYGQSAYGQSAPTEANGYSRTSGLNNPALRYFGGPAVRQPPSRRPAAMLPTVGPTRKQPIHKPFQGAVPNASVSPYLALDAFQSGALPNYYAFVQPQLQQQRQNQVQQAQYQQLQQQLRSANANAGVPVGARAGMTATGHTTQFQQYGGYFPLRQ